MTNRLPLPGSDDGQWGQILNDFLAVELNGDGSLKKASDITAAQNAASAAQTTANAAIPNSQKGVANGVAVLDSNSKLAVGALPTGVVNVSNAINGQIPVSNGNGTWTAGSAPAGPQGPVGPTGATGPTGAVGAIGSTGPAGAPGSVWRTGVGAPSSSLGVLGDFYLNAANGDFYEKTGASAYTLRGNLIGPQGPAGSGSSAPANSVAPAVTGTATTGSTLTTTNGTWSNTPTSYSYQWKRNSAIISGATSATYVLIQADEGQSIVCAVTASNANGGATANSNAVIPAVTPPANSTAPVVSGTAQTGQTLTTTNGVWSGSPTSYSYQWKRAGVIISGATATTYALIQSDEGQAIKCTVTATNAGGSVSADSNSVTPTAATVAPTNSVAPALSGSTTTGSTLSTTNGTWAGNPTPTYSYVWKRNNLAISGATASTYVLTQADEGQSIKCTVTASNTAGTASADSNTVTPTAAPAAPVNTVAPAVTGTAITGSTLTTSNGTWSGNPTPTYTYQWKRAGVIISGATSATYVLTQADEGQAIKCTVTGTNATSAVSADSNTVTPTAAPSAPVNSVAPAVTGTATTGSTLTTSNGTWSGSPAPTYTYQWKRAGVIISGATASTYVLQQSDEGQLVKCTVTATNASGSASADSNSVTPTAAPAAPVNTIAPALSGTAQTGSTLTSTTGTWTGNPTPTYTYQWKRNGTAISGATSNTYVLQVADQGQPILCTVTATNASGNPSANSNSVTPTAAPGGVPVNTAAPAVSGGTSSKTVSIGQPLSSSNGTWSNTPTSYTYQWYRLNFFGIATAISGATGSSYTTVLADERCEVRCDVTAVNGTGNSTAQRTNNGVRPLQGRSTNTVPNGFTLLNRRVGGIYDSYGNGNPYQSTSSANTFAGAKGRNDPAGYAYPGTWQTNSILGHGCLYSGKSYDGVSWHSGDNSNQFAGFHMTNWSNVTDKPGILVLHFPVNDLGAGPAPGNVPDIASTQANYQSMINTVLGWGGLPVLESMSPRNMYGADGTSALGQNYTKMSQTNDMLYNLSVSNNIPFIDHYDRLHVAGDGASTPAAREWLGGTPSTANPTSAYTSDGLHPNPIAVQVMGMVYAAVFLAVDPTPPRIPTVASESWNLQVNGRAQNFDGSSPAGWSGGFGNPTSVTVASDISTDSNYLVLPASSSREGGPRTITPNHRTLVGFGVKPGSSVTSNVNPKFVIAKDTSAGESSDLQPVGFTMAGGLTLPATCWFAGEYYDVGSGHTSAKVNFSVSGSDTGYGFGPVTILDKVASPTISG